ncbi:MAG: GntR family transcriptional regulator [Firmicutes bacterium]|nr:GntR family transcriptional regulator [Bacillota bacterium]
MAVNRKDPLPLYCQIKASLLSRIEALEPGTQIEPEMRLAQKYQVSRGTVKQAIQDLVTEGVLYRIQGKGTFVAQPKIQRSFQELPSFSEDIWRRGFQPGMRLIELVSLPAPSKVGAALRLSAHAYVWKLSRVRLADGEPIAWVISYLPYAMFDDLEEKDLKGSLYALLEERYHKRPAWAHDTYTAVNATTQVAQLLKVAKGTAIIYSERTAFLPDGSPVEFVESYVRGDRFVIHVDINHSGKD